MLRKAPLILAMIVGGYVFVTSYQRGPGSYLHNTIVAVSQLTDIR